MLRIDGSDGGSTREEVKVRSANCYLTENGSQMLILLMLFYCFKYLLVR